MKQLLAVLAGITLMSGTSVLANEHKDANHPCKECAEGHHCKDCKKKGKECKCDKGHADEHKTEEHKAEGEHH